MAGKTALAIPELLQNILNKCDHPRELSKAARVSKQWFAAAIPILWYGHWYEGSPWITPNFDFLVKLWRQDEDRFALYLRHIQLLMVTRPHDVVTPGYLDGSEEFMWESFNGKGLFWFWYSYDVEDHDITQELADIETHLCLLLKPSLSVLLTDMFPFNNRILHHVYSQCPDLRVLVSPLYGARCDVVILQKLMNRAKMEYLELCPNLSSPTEGPMSSSQLKTNTSSSHALQSLKLNLGMLPLLSISDSPLQNLSVYGVYATGPEIETRLQPITELHASLRYLDLKIQFPESSAESAQQEIVTICKKFTRLQHLAIAMDCCVGDMVTLEPLTMSQIHDMVENVPHLEVLRVKRVPAQSKEHFSAVLRLCRSFPNLHVVGLQHFFFNTDLRPDTEAGSLTSLEAMNIKQLAFDAVLNGDALSYIHSLLLDSHAQLSDNEDSRNTETELLTKFERFLDLARSCVRSVIGVDTYTDSITKLLRIDDTDLDWVLRTARFGELDQAHVHYIYGEGIIKQHGSIEGVNRQHSSIDVFEWDHLCTERIFDQVLNLGSDARFAGRRCSHYNVAGL